MIEFTPVAVLQNRITQASRNGITYLRRSSESQTCCPQLRPCCVRRCRHLLKFQRGLLGTARMQQRGVCLLPSIRAEKAIAATL